MKFLKLVMNEKTKKIIFKDEYSDIKKLRLTISSIFMIPVDIFTFHFVDLENQIITIEDNFDLEYFIECNQENTLGEMIINFNESDQSFIALEEEKSSKMDLEESFQMNSESNENKLKNFKKI